MCQFLFHYVNTISIDILIEATLIAKGLIRLLFGNSKDKAISANNSEFKFLFTAKSTYNHCLRYINNAITVSTMLAMNKLIAE